MRKEYNSTEEDFVFVAGAGAVGRLRRDGTDQWESN